LVSIPVGFCLFICLFLSKFESSQFEVQMAPVVLKSFELPLDCEDFLHKFWFNIAFLERFLIEKLLDVGVEIEDWKQIGDHPINRSRTVRSLHPSKISFPGLPSHAESIKVQTIECRSVPEQTIDRVKIKEVNSFSGIPYSDYFHVMIEWEVKSKDHPSKENSAGSKKIQINVSLDIKFLKSTWLQSTIESNTKAELMEVYELWINFANECLQHDTDMHKRHRHEEGTLHRKQQLSIQDPAQSAPSKSIGNDNEYGKVSPKSPTNVSATRSSLASLSRESSGSNSSLSKRRGPAQHAGHFEYHADDTLTAGDEEEDLLFYDCEQGEHSSIPLDLITEAQHSGRASFMNDTSSHSILYQRVVPPPTPPDLRRLYPSRSLESLSAHGANVRSHDRDYHKSSFDDSENRLEGEEAMINGGGSSHSSEDEEQRNSEESRKKRYQKQLRQYRHGSARDKAIQVVETIFVLLEFSFWQVGLVTFIVSSLISN
jgi:hypothetical protein